MLVFSYLPSKAASLLILASSYQPIQSDFYPLVTVACFYSNGRPSLFNYLMSDAIDRGSCPARWCPIDRQLILHGRSRTTSSSILKALPIKCLNPPSSFTVKAARAGGFVLRLWFPNSERGTRADAGGRGRTLAIVQICLSIFSDRTDFFNSCYRYGCWHKFPSR